MDPSISSPTVPCILHQTGATSNLTWEERILLRRTRRLFDGWDYKHWTDDDLAELFAKEFPQWSSRYNQVTKGVVKADLGRYAILYVHGGLYIDTDYKFLRYPVGMLNARCTLPIEDGEMREQLDSCSIETFRLGNACLASVRKYPFWFDLLDCIFRTWSSNDLNLGDPIETTGPLSLTKYWLSKSHTYEDISTPRKVEFYPDLTWSRVGIARSKETAGIHLCWGTWRRRNMLHNVKTIARRKVSCLN